MIFILFFYFACVTRMIVKSRFRLIENIFKTLKALQFPKCYFQGKGMLNDF